MKKKIPTRKARIRELYQMRPPIKKSTMVDLLFREGYRYVNEDEKDARHDLLRAVENEAARMRDDGMDPQWLPEERIKK